MSTQPTVEAAVECQFDGLVGPSHNFAGLAQGNLAAQGNAGSVSNPRAAALQGLAKMRAVAEAGIPQGWLPPPLRPDLDFLRGLGFAGSTAQVLSKAAAQAPDMLRVAWSASAMWVANAATVSPAADTADGAVHFSPANLLSHAHRAIEAPSRMRHLQAIFAGPNFRVHPPLAAVPELADEGAANHTRLGSAEQGLHLFVYGRHGQRFRARQTLNASRAVARRHGLAEERCVYLEQSALAIDAGVFHNDVIAVGHRDLHLSHALAYSDAQAAKEAVFAAAASAGLAPPRWIVAPEQSFGLEQAVQSYLFNSQLLDGPDGQIWLLGSDTIAEAPGVLAWLEGLVSEGFLSHFRLFDLRQSMRNGGGPACLRLRVPLTAQQRAAVLPGAWCHPAQLDRLEAWVRQHYRDRLALDDLRDPALVEEVLQAQQALGDILGWPALADAL